MLLYNDPISEGKHEVSNIYSYFQVHHPKKQELTHILCEMQPIEHRSALMGVTSAGLPFIRDFDSPVSSSVLIVGDAGIGKTHILKTISVSALYLNRVDDLRCTVLTHSPNEWFDVVSCNLIKDSTQLEIVSWADKIAKEILPQLANSVEYQLTHLQNKPGVLLIVDDLSQIMKYPDITQEALMWLIYYGPRAGCWPIVTLNANRVDQINQWIDLFCTKLIGRVASPVVISKLGCSNYRVGELAEREFFYIGPSGNAVKIWIPML
ncbi:MAG: hypothetical protein AB1894_18320 [Chloroflexota bacterium]